jgi:hypothetical protein
LYTSNRCIETYKIIVSTLVAVKCTKYITAFLSINKNGRNDLRDRSVDGRIM